MAGLRELSEYILVVVASIIMAFKPILLHLTKSQGEQQTMPPEYLLLGSEFLKISICASILSTRSLAGLPTPVWCGFKHTLLFATPAAIYLVMNILTVEAARLLDPPILQLVANLKVSCTAVLSWALLSRRLSLTQWFSMFPLTLGVMLGQWPSDGSQMAFARSSTHGVILMIVNSFLSSLGGVWTEKVLKGSASAELSIFATNLHMAIHTFVINSVAVGVRGLPPPSLPSTTVLVAVVNEAVNGILISMLMRRFDSITKNFAFCVSVFITAGISFFFLEFQPTWFFFAGALLVSSSVMLYTRSPVKIEEKSR
eukprot:TRINITY_DN25346_c0_g3_i2.p1 TRINITY_DN25346_c0_g3~~TRINITY_DN25346_c0_g3_i2.p1  ORF type:complete len:324 (-),score=34.82 TRINITY_DN25346_c0_g3_i2:99-1037(-)